MTSLTNSNLELKKMFGQIMKMNTASSSGSRTLPSNTIINPKEDLKGITTRSGTAYQGPTIPTTSSSPPPQVVKCKTEVTKNTVPLTNNGSTKDVQPPVVQIEIPIPNFEPVVSPIIEPVVAPVSAQKPNHKPSMPYPSRFDDQKLCDTAKDQTEKFFQIFKDLDFSISFTDALILMPKFGPTIKTLADLGASINLMPLSVSNKLSLPELIPTLMTLELADRSISQPIGVTEDVFVKVGKFHFLADFVVVDFDANPRVPLILGRSFLKTGKALIDVYEGELTLRVGKEAITFNLDQTSRYSANYNDMTANRIDVIDMACEEYSQEVLSFSDVIISGNLTPYYDPIVYTSSPTLTTFGDCGFLLEEVDAFLALEDDPTSPEVDHSYFDTEGDILLLKAFLNDDPSLPPPTQGKSHVDPTLLNDFEMATEGNGDPTVPDLRTIEELCQPSLNGQGGPITPIAIQATNFGLKNDMIQQVQNSFQFHRLSGDDANKHLDKFLHVTQSIKVNGVTDVAFVYTFYNGLTLRHRDTINAAAGGTFMKRQINKNLMKVLQINQQVKAVTPSCETCGGPHSYNDCQSVIVQTQNIYATGVYQGGNSYQPQGASHGRNPPPAYQATAYQASGYQALVHQPLIPQPQVMTTNEFTNYMKANDAILKNMQTNMISLVKSNLVLKNMFGHFMKMNTASSSGSRTLRSNTVTNPKEDLKGITTRSGIAYQGPTITTTSSSSPKVAERETEVTKTHRLLLITEAPKTSNLRLSKLKLQYQILSPLLLPSSSKLSRDQNSNPNSSTNPTPKGRIRRSSKQKVENSNFEENPLPLIPMAENQTMAQLLQAPTGGYKDEIVIPEIAATNFELKHGLINLVQNK
nr:reverse transcriptase domain-containing protein [Tanacetum cinerariifolium]